MEVQLHAFLISALDGGEWSALRSGYFISGVRAPGTQWIELYIRKKNIKTQKLKIEYMYNSLLEKTAVAPIVKKSPPPFYGT
jgi:hypothetical protein